MASVSFDRRRGAHPLAQQELLDLAGGSLRQLAEDNASRHLESREMAAAVLDDRLLGELGPRLELDERAGGFAPPWIGSRDDGRGEHGRMPVEDVLDLDRADVLAA